MNSDGNSPLTESISSEGIFTTGVSIDSDFGSYSMCLDVSISGPSISPTFTGVSPFVL